MKQKITSLLAILALLLTAGCDDFLDKESYTDHEETILKTPEGMQALLNGIYDIISGEYYYGRHMYAYEACKGTDFFVRVSSGNNYERECRYAESTSSSGYAGNAWKTIYSAIRTATNLTEAIDEANLPQADANRILGEARALRALAYFDLMRLFAYPPRFSVPGGAEYHERYQWGVPIIRDMETVNNIFRHEIRRETAEKTFKYIEDELIAAEALLEGAAVQQGHINAVATGALLTRLYLYEERWDDVITQGEKTLSTAAANYSMLKYDSYKTNYYQPFNSENIWEIVYSMSDNNKANSLNWLVRRPTYQEPGSEKDGEVSQAVGYAAYGLTEQTQKLLNKKANGVSDARSYLICQLGISTHPEYRGFRKYVGSGYHYLHNIPVVRLPELHLSLAEAYLHAENLAMAEQHYNTVRSARICSEGFLSGTDLEACLEEVMEERHREFILEGHNYWDSFRRGVTIKREKLLENLNKTTVAFGYNSGKSNARTQVIYPIPLGELEANIAIRDQQNPGYDTYDDVYEK